METFGREKEILLQLFDQILIISESRKYEPEDSAKIYSIFSKLSELHYRHQDYFSLIKYMIQRWKELFFLQIMDKSNANLKPSPLLGCWFEEKFIRRTCLKENLLRLYEKYEFHEISVILRSQGFMKEIPSIFTIYYYFRRGEKQKVRETIDDLMLMWMFNLEQYTDTLTKILYYSQNESELVSRCLQCFNQYSLYNMDEENIDLGSQFLIQFCYIHLCDTDKDNKNKILLEGIVSNFLNMNKEGEEYSVNSRAYLSFLQTLLFYLVGQHKRSKDKFMQLFKQIKEDRENISFYHNMCIYAMRIMDTGLINMLNEHTQ